MPAPAGLRAACSLPPPRAGPGIRAAACSRAPPRRSGARRETRVACTEVAPPGVPAGAGVEGLPELLDSFKWDEKGLLAAVVQVPPVSLLQ